MHFLIICRKTKMWFCHEMQRNRFDGGWWVIYLKSYQTNTFVRPLQQIRNTSAQDRCRFRRCLWFLRPWVWAHLVHVGSAPLFGSGFQTTTIFVWLFICDTSIVVLLLAYVQLDSTPPWNLKLCTHMHDARQRTDTMLVDRIVFVLCK